MDKHLSSDELTVFLSLLEIGKVLDVAVSEQLMTDGSLTRVQFQILAVLRRSQTGQERISDIADILHVSKSGLSYQINLLIKRGLIVGEQDKHDERSTLISLSAEGVSAIDKVFPGHIRIVRQLLLDHLGSEEIEQLKSTLGTIRERLTTVTSAQ